MRAASQLAELAARCTPSARILGDPEVEVTGISHDSRRVAVGDLFVCIEGETVDGHEFAETAIARGAAALMVRRELPVDVPQLVVDDPRRDVGPVASAVHDDPSRSVTVVGITGTNGKTTTAHLLGAALEGAGRLVQVHGTLSGERTTPEAPELQVRLAEARGAGVDTVIMEVSSHALAMHRVDGTRFAAAVFTNLGHDHLDLHGTPEAYFRAKAMLFDPALSDLAIVNVDDPRGRQLADTIDLPTHRFSIDDAHDVSIGASELHFGWRDVSVVVPIGGAINLSNALAALTTAVALGTPAEVAARSIAGAAPIAGRFEVVATPPESEFSVIVDYAHTPDGIATLLASVRPLAHQGRVIAVFGCGGDRDVDKRPAMGRAATDGADVVIVTSDNPRHEAPSSIADDIVSDMDADRRARTTVELDRRAAIARALELASVGDVVVIAGKGHERTQTIGDDARPFDDRTVARELIEGWAS